MVVKIVFPMITFSYSNCYGLKVWGTFLAPTYGSYGRSHIFRGIIEVVCSQELLPFLNLAKRIYTSPENTCRSTKNAKLGRFPEITTRSVDPWEQTSHISRPIGTCCPVPKGMVLDWAGYAIPSRYSVLSKPIGISSVHYYSYLLGEYRIQLPAFGNSQPRVYS